MSKHPRHKAFSILSKILWERRFKKKKDMAIVNGGKMEDSDFEKCKLIIEELKNKNEL